MTDFTKGIIVIVLLWISNLRLISSSPYCEFDSCDETEYCCRDNECCKNPIDNIHFMAWILAGLLIVTIIFGIIYKCKSRLYRFFSIGSESESLTNNPKA